MNKRFTGFKIIKILKIIFIILQKLIKKWAHIVPGERPEELRYETFNYTPSNTNKHIRFARCHHSPGYLSDTS